MLVLTRRTGESIVIGNDIVVTVLEVRHDQVRIGIDAPRAVQVHREEVFQQVMRENTAAAAASTSGRGDELLRRPLPKRPPGAKTGGVRLGGTKPQAKTPQPPKAEGEAKGEGEPDAAGEAPKSP